MAKTRKEAEASGPKVEQNGSWFTITAEDGTEHKVQGEGARDAKLEELATASGDPETDVEEDYDEPPEPGTQDDREREPEEDTTPATDPDATGDDVGETAKNFEAGNVSEEADKAIPSGVRAKQPGAKSTEEQEVEEGVRDEDEAFVPEETRLAREDDERRTELKDLAPEEAHARQARRATEAGAARTRRPVVPGPKSDTALPRTAADKDVPEDIEEDADRDPDQVGTAAVTDHQTAIDARGYQTSNDGRGPFTAETLVGDAADRRDEDRERREMLADMTPEERQEYLVEEAEEAEEDKPEVARKPALRAALDDTIETNVSARSGIPTGPANHPPIERGAASVADRGNTLHGWSAPQKTAALLERPDTDEDRFEDDESETDES